MSEVNETGKYEAVRTSTDNGDLLRAAVFVSVVEVTV